MMKYFAQFDKAGNVEMVMATPMEAELDEAQDNFRELSEKEYKSMKGRVGEFRVDQDQVVEKAAETVYDDKKAGEAVLRVGDDK